MDMVRTDMARMDVARMDVAIVGGGIAGLSLALNLHKHGMRCRVFERAPEIRELGVGITLLPHAMREFAAFGLEDELVHAGALDVALRQIVAPESPPRCRGRRPR